MLFKASKLTIFSLAILGSYASAQASDSALDVPAKLRPGAAESFAMSVHADGVQIYDCRAAKDKTAYEWQFVAPEADLYDLHGAKIGTHYAGPHWESADGSRIVGTVREHEDAPSAGAIAWLLLSAKSVGPEGAFSKVTSVQRVHTSGGAAPRDGCSQATAGKQARVNYTADYYFYTRAAASASRDFDIGAGD